MKTCACGTELKRPRGSGQWPQRCPPCKIDRRRERDRNNTREYRKTDEYKKKYREYMMLKNYGITAQQYTDMLEAQGGSCAICDTDSPGKKDWHIDHCHEGGHVRGILCQKCNLMVGLAGDNPDTLLAAAAYLRPVGWTAPDIASIIGKATDAPATHPA